MNKLQESNLLLTKFITAATDFLELFQNGYMLEIDDLYFRIDKLKNTSIEPNQENKIFEDIKDFYHLCKYCTAKLKNLHYGFESQFLESSNEPFISVLGVYALHVDEKGEVPSRISKMSNFAILHLVNKNEIIANLFLSNKIHEIGEEMLNAIDSATFTYFDYLNDIISIKKYFVDSIIVEFSNKISSTKNMITYSHDHMKKFHKL
jgi:hypothetical protein